MSLDALAFAFAAAVDPLMLTLVVVLLSRPRPGLLLTSFLVGGYLASTALCLALVEGLGRIGFEGFGSIPAIPRIVLGVVLVIGVPVAFRYARGREEGAPPPAWLARFLDRAGPFAVFLLGAVVSLPGGSTLAGMAAIAATDPSVPSALFQVAIFNVILFVTAEIPLAVHVLRPEASERVIGRLRVVMLRWGPPIGLVVLTALGLFLLVSGAIDL